MRLVKDSLDISTAIAIIVMLTILIGSYMAIEEDTVITAAKVANLVEFKYIGNIKTKLFCLNNRDNLEKIPEELIVYFKSIEEAENLSYKHSDKC